MFVITHAGLPVLAAEGIDWWWVAHDRRPRFSRGDLAVIAVGGLLPDLFSVHLTLQARHASPTHTVFFPLLLLAAVGPALLPRWRRWLPTLTLAWLGVCLHLAADAISGGIPLLGVGHPIIGNRLVPADIWLWCDLAVVLAVWAVSFRTRYLLAGGRPEATDCRWEAAMIRYWQGPTDTRRSTLGSEGTEP